jgi:AcrR family transcriptional regulator
MTDTKQRILDTAERLIAEQGYAATSLRHIIAEAGVNLAAIHYHFGSKEELLDEVIQRKIGPVNEQRLAWLDRLEREAAPASPGVDSVLESFFWPMAEAADRTPEFVPFMGRMLAEGMMPAILARHFQQVTTRLMEALRRAAPQLPEEEFSWRMHFMSGAIAHTMCGARLFPSLGGAGSDFRTRIAMLATFLSAGFRAPETAPQTAPEAAPETNPPTIEPRSEDR